MTDSNKNGTENSAKNDAEIRVGDTIKAFTKYGGELYWGKVTAIYEGVLFGTWGNIGIYPQEDIVSKEEFPDIDLAALQEKLNNKEERKTELDRLMCDLDDLLVSGGDTKAIAEMVEMAVRFWGNIHVAYSMKAMNCNELIDFVMKKM